MFVSRRISALSLILAMMGAVTVLGTAGPFIEVPGNDPWIAQLPYRNFPWQLQSDYALAFSVLPVAKAPVNPDGWAGYPQLPGFLPGPGVLVVLRYKDSPIGKYSELVYSAGLYSPRMCFLKQFQSVHRIWVDSEYSRRAGRNIWGFPKELATFTWKDVSGNVQVTVKDSKSGTVIFNATVTQLPVLDTATNQLAVSMASKILPSCMPSLQWPIDDNTYNTSNSIYASVPVYSTAQQVVAAAHAANVAALASGASAAAAAAKYAAAMQPLRTDICFDLAGGSVVKAERVTMDAGTLTGRATDKLSVLPLGMRLKNGAVSTLSKPGLVDCW